MSNYTLYLSRANKAYIVGLNSDRGFVLRNGDEHIIVFVDSRYYQHFAKNNLRYTVIKANNGIDDVIDYLIQNGQDQLNVDFQTLSHSLARKIINSGISLIDQSESKLREIKTTVELVELRTLAKLTDDCFTTLLPKLKLGQTEKQVARLLNDILIEKGFDQPSFPIIVAFAENSSVPHHKPQDKKLENNMNILIDFGGKKGNLNTDLTRNIYIGNPPDEYKQVYQLVYNAQSQVFARSHKQYCDMQQTVTDYFTENKVLDLYLHNIGHGVGYEVHEYPSLDNSNCDQVMTNTVVTIEPGLYLDNKFGIRIEDMCVIKDGKIDAFTASPKEVVCLNLN